VVCARCALSARCLWVCLSAQYTHCLLWVCARCVCADCPECPVSVPIAQSARCLCQSPRVPGVPGVCVCANRPECPVCPVYFGCAINIISNGSVVNSSGCNGNYSIPGVYFGFVTLELIVVRLGACLGVCLWVCVCLHSNLSVVNSNTCVLIYGVCGQSVHSIPLESIVMCLRVCFVAISGVLFWVCCFLVRF